MLHKLITRLRRPGSLHTLLALCLLVSLTQGVGHDHEENRSDGAAQQCYVCHLSSDLGPVATVVVPDTGRAPGSRAAPDSPRDPLRGALAVYHARGPPPLLS